MFFALSNLVSAQPFAHWTKIESGYTNKLNDVLFVEDIEKGFISGDGIILRTTNHGLKWDSMRINQLDYNSKPYNYNTIFSFSQFSYALFGGGINALTTDGGNTWTYPDFDDVCYKFSFPSNKDVGFALQKLFFYGASDMLSITTNGGTSWSWTGSIMLDEQKEGTLNDISFVNLNNGFIIGSKGNIWKTIDQGVTLIGPLFSPTTQNLNSICFVNKNNKNKWIIVGENGVILKTVDGISWYSIVSGTESNLKKVVFTTDSTVGVIVGEEGKILTSYDQGDSWNVYTWPSGDNLNGICIPPNQNKVAYIVGSGGIILKTDDLTDVIDNTDPITSDLSISPNPATDKLTISFSNSELINSSISIFNSLGIELKRFDKSELFGKSSINFSTEEFPSGIYYCTLNTGINRITKSFIIIK